MNNKNIATLATKALLYEVSISPKAGLVSRLSNGSHKDMNFYTFIDSSLALHNYFLNCFDYGQEKLFSCPNFFKDLREVGKVAEKEMYENFLELFKDEIPEEFFEKRNRYKD